ncbi:hypothetical protein J6590_077834 [Homalodisca vitripennis]|nr:hypothetical protein J6590_077834 [Homalodisca vitripennis]
MYEVDAWITAVRGLCHLCYDNSDNSTLKPTCHLNLGNLIDVQEKPITNCKCRDSRMTVGVGGVCSLTSEVLASLNKGVPPPACFDWKAGSELLWGCTPVISHFQLHEWTRALFVLNTTTTSTSEVFLFSCDITCTLTSFSENFTGISRGPRPDLATRLFKGTVSTDSGGETWQGSAATGYRSQFKLTNLRLSCVHFVGGS